MKRVTVEQRKLAIPKLATQQRANDLYVSDVTWQRWESLSDQFIALQYEMAFLIEDIIENE